MVLSLDCAEDQGVLQFDIANIHGWAGGFIDMHSQLHGQLLVRKDNTLQFLVLMLSEFATSGVN